MRYLGVRTKADSTPQMASSTARALRNATPMPTAIRMGRKRKARFQPRGSSSFWATR